MIYRVLKYFEFNVSLFLKIIRCFVLSMWSYTYLILLYAVYSFCMLLSVDFYNCLYNYNTNFVSLTDLSS